MAADRNAPILTSLTLPGTVDVTTGLRTVTLGVGATDAGEGVDRVVVRLDRSFATSASSVTSTLTFTDAADSFADGLSTRSQRFDPGSGAGTYTVTGVEVFDKAGNLTAYNNADLVRLGIASSFQIASNTPADTSKPTLIGLTLPTSIDVTNAGDDDGGTPITARVSDTGSGVASVVLTLDRPFDNGDSYVRTITIADSADDPFADGQGTGYPVFVGGTPPGTYTVVGAVVTDKVGNATSYDAAALAAANIATGFEVISDQPLDTARPVLTAFDLPDVVDVTDGNTFLGISATATDIGTAIDRVSIRFDRAFTDRNGAVSSVTLFDRTDSLTDGATLTRSLFASSQPGTYFVTGVTVYDVVGNSTFYGPTGLAARGFATSFQVADRTIAPTASVTAPVAIAEDGGAALALSLTFAGGGAASGAVTMAFAAARSTATNGADIDVPSFSSTYTIDPSAPGTYVLALPPIAVLADQVVEGTETVAVTIRAAGQIFDTGSDTKTVLVSLVDSGQTGGAGADTIAGTRFGDRLSGAGGDDRLTGGLGDDLLDGGAGYDTAVFAAAFRQASVSVTSGGTIVAGPEGTDTATGVERFQFVDGTYVIDPDSAGAQVQRLYDTVLGRAPDAVGLDYWVDRMEDTGLSLAGVAGTIAGSAEFQAATGGLGNAAFVDYVYGRALGRAPDQGGRDYWAGRLDAGLSRGDMLVNFSESGEHRARTADLVGRGYFQTDDNAQAVALLYDSFTGRRPDAGGLGFWTGQLQSGTYTLSQVADAFAASAEFQNAVRGKTSAELVDLLYANTLDRAADGGGRAYWVDQLDRGLTQGQILLSFAQSAEHAQLLASQIVYGVDVSG